MRLFKLTDAHIKLMRALNVSERTFDPRHGEGPFGFDGKRPFGNSHWHKDMCEIVGLPIADGEIPESLCDYLDTLYRQLGVALEVVLATGEFKAGNFEAPDYTTAWRRVS